jgi:hypothetical protein
MRIETIVCDLCNKTVEVNEKCAKIYYEEFNGLGTSAIIDKEVCNVCRKKIFELLTDLYIKTKKGKLFELKKK